MDKPAILKENIKELKIELHNHKIFYSFFAVLVFFYALSFAMPHISDLIDEHNKTAYTQLEADFAKYCNPEITPNKK